MEEDEAPVKKLRKPDKRSTQEREPFQGFRKPESAFFRLPNEWTDITADITSLAELKIIEYIARHTWGFNEFGAKKEITTDEFMYGRWKNDDTRFDKGTQLSDRGVKDGVELAEKHGYIEVETDTSDKARIRKFYGLKMFPAQSDGKKLPTTNSSVDRRKLPGNGKTLPIKRGGAQEETSYRSKKDKEETHQEKDSDPSSSLKRGKRPDWLTRPIKKLTSQHGVYEQSGKYIDQVYTLYQEAKNKGLTVLEIRTFFETTIAIGEREGIDRFIVEMGKLLQRRVT